MSLVRGIPQVMWVSKRLGAQAFAVCADITKDDRVTFWLCTSLDVERWLAVEVLDVSPRSSDSHVYIAAECWMTAARERLPQLIHPSPHGERYVVEGIDA